MADTKTKQQKLAETYEKDVKAVSGNDKLKTDEKTKQLASLKETFDAEIAAADVNDSRTGKGTRLNVSSTRGRNTQVVTYEAFDEGDSKTLPESIAEFMALSGVDDEALLVSFLITGYNDNSFRIASDPVQEFVNPVWPAEVAKSFKDSVKTLVKNGVFESIEEAVSAIRPKVEVKFGGSANQ